MVDMSTKKINAIVSKIKPNKVYLDEVERLAANPSKISDAWFNAKPLFKYTSTAEHGCLTQVHRGTLPAPTYELSTAIAADSLLVSGYEELDVLPPNSDELKKRLLRFAKWQTFLGRIRQRNYRIFEEENA